MHIYCVVYLKFQMKNKITELVTETTLQVLWLQF